MSTPLLTPADVAGRLQVTTRTLRRWVSQGLFPPPVRFNRQVTRWHPSAVEAALAGAPHRPRGR